MKKFVSLVLAIMLISVFCVPAFADDAPIDCTPSHLTGDMIDIRKPGNYIISESCTVRYISENTAEDETYTLTIPENVTVTVTGNIHIHYGTIELLGTLDVSHTPDIAPGHLHIGDTGNYIDSDTNDVSIEHEPPSSSEDPHRYTTLFSGGNVAIIVGIACFAAGFLVAMFVFKKKKQPKGEE